MPLSAIPGNLAEGHEDQVAEDSDTKDQIQSPALHADLARSPRQAGHEGQEKDLFPPVKVTEHPGHRW